MKLAAFVLGSSLLIVAPVAARAQAYVDEPNSLSARLGYTFAPSGTLEVEGAQVPNVLIIAHYVTLGADYVTPIEGLQVELELPMVVIKRGEGSFQHFPQPGEWDDGDTHYGFTDLKGGLRYQIKPIEKYLGLSIAAGGLYPTWDYPVVGFTAPSHHLWGIYGEVAVARTLDPLLSNLFVAGTFTYMKRQKVNFDADTEEFNRDYSEVAFALGYFLPAGFTVTAVAQMRETYGGITFDTLIEQPESVILHHDQLLDEDLWLAGGEVGYQVNDRIDLSASVRFFLSGVNTRSQNLFGLQAGYRFF